MANADQSPVAAREVAIVVPCHGYAQYLGEAVRSAAEQTWQQLRIIIVDDGSPDATADVAAELIAAYPQRRIALLRQANRGLGAARNAGIRATSSPFVLPLDADDRLRPDAVAMLMAALEREQADIATPLGERFGAEQGPLVTLPATRRRLLAGNCLVYASLFRRAVFERVGGYATDLQPAGYEDWDFWLSALEHGARFTHVAQPLFGYRRHGASMLGTADRSALALRAAIHLRHPGLYSPGRRQLAARIAAGGANLRGWRRWLGLGLLLWDRRFRQFWRQCRLADQTACPSAAR